MEDRDLLLISEYLAGSLSLEELAAVDLRLQEDKAFQEAFLLKKSYHAIWQAVHRADTKAEIKSQWQAFRKEEAPIAINRPIIPLWVPMALAACLVILILIWSPWTSSPLPDQMAMAQLEPFPVSMARAPQTDVDSMQAQAFLAYQQGAYEDALPLLQALLQRSPEDESLSMMLGSSLSQTGRYREALLIYRQLPADSPFRDAIDWNTALHLVITGQIEEARVLLEKLQGSSHYRQTEAGELLETLQR